MAAFTGNMTTNPVDVDVDIQKMKTLIVVILDESTSMKAQIGEVIAGYNKFLSQQRELTEDQARLVLVKFSDDVSVGHGAMDIASVPGLSTQNYKPNGNTALYDAVADGIRIGEGAIQTGERVLVLIMTDGEENASKKYNSLKVRQLIAAHEALGNWTFAYIGENPERWAKEMRQDVTNTARYDLKTQGSNFANVAVVASNFRIQPQQQQCQGLFSTMNLGGPTPMGHTMIVRGPTPMGHTVTLRGPTPMGHNFATRGNMS